MTEVIKVIAATLVCILIADFLSGLFHWMEDTFWDIDTPLLGKWVVRHNIVHHHDPRAFTHKSWIRSARTTITLAIILMGIAWLAGWFNWMVVLTAVLGANANEIHKWSHRTRSENGRLIVLSQQVGLLQSPAHHARHHRDGKDTHYCVITNLVNPVLDGVHFWRVLEFICCRVLGLEKRPDDSLAAFVPTDTPTP